jgi:hypothetical protein
VQDAARDYLGTFPTAEEAAIKYDHAKRASPGVVALRRKFKFPREGELGNGQRWINNIGGNFQALVLCNVSLDLFSV